MKRLKHLFLLAGLVAAPSAALADTFSYTGSEQQYTVTTTGTYFISGSGASARCFSKSSRLAIGSA